MIIYFADRKMNILGQASTELPEGLVIADDIKVEDVDTGVASFECWMHYDEKTRSKIKTCAKVGNYILRSHNGENEFYTIIDSETDTKNQEVYMYCEDAGLDLLNEVVGSYSADKAYSIDFYINKFAYDSGFIIGINEIPDLTRKLSWDGEATVTERLASVATQFDGCEISYSFDIKGLEVTNKYINIFKRRGKDIGCQLRLNQDIDRIITKESIANMATALMCTGGTPENSETPITLSGYEYDDGNYYVDGVYLKSREALKKWSRYIWSKEPNKQTNEGHITKTYSYDTLSQKTLCAHAVTKLKKICEIEVNYEVDINKLPENIKIGDRINIIDDDMRLYVSARLLKLEVSAVKQEQTATIGEYLIKGSGITQKVADLATQFQKTSQSAAAAQSTANAAKETADEAKTNADSALTESQNAQTTANEAKETAENAQSSASEAQTAANEAQEAVRVVEESVSSLETTVNNAQAAADQAQQAAETANAKAEEAATAAGNAQTAADEAKTAAGNAQTAAEAAQSTASTAQSTASTAKSQAESASATAAAAKADAEAAQADIDALGDELTTVSNTMQADYARKTDLTEATASLQTQITQNAEQISSTAKKVQTIDETANNAAEQAATAQTTASEAKTQANQATAEAAAAQTAADEAKASASTAQSEADKAKAAAATAQAAADKADADLTAAKADLATVTSRVDATEEEIAAAQAKVDTAQAAADKAKSDAATATTKAETAQAAADEAANSAAAAQATANDAADKATVAQAAADKAKGDASAAQATANEAKQTAEDAQATANTAKTNAENAQATANAAASEAAAAQTAADEADTKAAQAAADLETAKQNLENVTSRVDATEAEVEAAQAAVNEAQAAADAAAANAATAQATADQAKANATAAQTAADNAKTAADNAQKAADEAQAAADEAQAAVDALAVRVTTAETQITQNSEQIALRATKTEVTETLGGYYTKEEAEASIEVSANAVKTEVANTYATKDELSSKSDELGQSISEQSTSTVNTCEEIILEALKSYTETGEFETFKETVESQLTLLADEMTLKFTETTESLESVNADLQDKFNTFTKYFTFDINGLTIGESGSLCKVVIDNDVYRMIVDGKELFWISNGKVHTPEIEITQKINLFGYIIDKDSAGNVNVEYVGTIDKSSLNITEHPQDVSVAVGQTAIFTVKASGYKVSYQWQYKQAIASSWANSTKDEAKTSRFTITPANTSVNGQKVRCMITDEFGNVAYSDAAVMTVTDS